MEEPDFKGKTILAVGAHPDDNDFGCGATMAKAAANGATVYYLLATAGQRGSNDPNLTGDKLAQIYRHQRLSGYPAVRSGFTRLPSTPSG